MSEIQYAQTNFGMGEIDPIVTRRLDMAQYKTSLAKARNVVIQPQGGMRARPGTKFLFEIPSAAVPEDGVRFIPFQFSEDDSYMLLFVKQRMYVFKNDALVTNINGSGNDYLATGIGLAKTIEMQWTQSFDTMLLFHPRMQSRVLVRGATDADWTISNITWGQRALYAFTLSESNPPHRLYVENPSGNTIMHAEGTRISITNSAGVGATAYAVVNGSGGIGSVTVVDPGRDYSGTVTVTAIGTGSGATLNATVSGGQITGITVAAAGTGWGQGPFTAADVGQYIYPNNGLGRARIVDVLSDTTVRVSMVSPFAQAGYIKSGDWTLESGYEDAWSNARGWPRCGVFHKGRLILGGTDSLPSKVWGSKIGDYYNFNPGDGLDDEGLDTIVDSTEGQIITNVKSGTDLQVFTTSAEFYLPESDLQGITPSNFRFKKSGNTGAQLFSPIIEAEGSVIFIQRSGQQIIEMLPAGGDTRYQSNDITVMSSHLLKSPSDMAYMKKRRSDEGNLIMAVNDDDGSIYVLSVLRGQDVASASYWDTDGSFKAVGVDVDTIYVVVEREVDGNTVYFFEIFDYTATTDACKQGAAASSATLSHLPNTDAQVITDDYYQGVITSNGSGVFDFLSASTVYYEVGLPYTVEAKSLPLSIINGAMLGYEKKRVVQIGTFVNNTQSLAVNGRRHEFSHDGGINLAKSVTPFTGLVSQSGFLGWDHDISITFTRPEPLAWSVLAYDARMQIGGL